MIEHKYTTDRPSIRRPGALNREPIQGHAVGELKLLRMEGRIVSPGTWEVIEQYIPKGA